MNLLEIKESTASQIAEYTNEMTSLQTKMEEYIKATNRFNELTTKLQYLQAIVNNVDLLMGEDEVLNPAQAEDPWAFVGE